MNKIISVLFLVIAALPCFSQNNTEPAPPFKRFPTIPPFRLLLSDSATFFTKDNLPDKTGTMFMLFSPDCDHCKHETEEIISHIGQFKNIHIVMATPLPLDKMKEFYRHYDLGRFKNITVGRDVDFVLPVFFGVRSLPFLAFYNKKGNLIDTFQGNLPIERVLEKFKE